jgi:hypothetical protein
MVKQQIDPLRDPRLRDVVLVIPSISNVKSQRELMKLLVEKTIYYSNPRVKLPKVPGLGSVTPHRSWKNMYLAGMYLLLSEEDRLDLHEWYHKYSDELSDAALNDSTEMPNEKALKIPCGLDFLMVKRLLIGYFDTERFGINVVVMSKAFANLKES